MYSKPEETLFLAKGVCEWIDSLKQGKVLMVFLCWVEQSIRRTYFCISQTRDFENFTRDRREE